MERKTMENKDDADPRYLQLWVRMLSSSTRVTQILNKRMKEHTPLTLAKFDVLVAIDRAPGGVITMSELSRMLLVSNANTTGMVGRLMKDGLVEKWALPTDRRVYSVSMTSEGRRVLKNAITIHKGWVDELLGGIGEENLESQIALFSHFKKSLSGIEA
ncbi:MarR family winged helix-turn-helix transcriptional regulator [Paremcibacter congregatus]|nr:MarR family transcriptional regulator [Paremcibacter congregatus]